MRATLTPLQVLADNVDKISLMLQDLQEQIALDGLEVGRVAEALPPVQGHLFRVAVTLRELALGENVTVKPLGSE